MAADNPDALTKNGDHGHADHGQAEHGHGGHEQPQAGAIDPVCGMTVDPHKTPHRAEYAGHP
jgi:P-type Cu+ transporter